MTAKQKQVQNNIAEITRRAVPVLKKYPINRAGLFGSVVRGAEKKDSDIDMLIDIPDSAEISLLDFVHIKHELEDKIGKKVDLVEYQNIKPLLKEYIIPYEVRIYEKDS